MFNNGIENTAQLSDCLPSINNNAHTAIQTVIFRILNHSGQIYPFYGLTTCQQVEFLITKYKVN